MEKVREAVRGRGMIVVESERTKEMVWL